MTQHLWLRVMLRVVLVLVVLLLGTALVVRLYGQHRLAQARTAAEQVFAGLTVESCAPPLIPAAEDPAPLLRAGAVAWSVSEGDVGFLSGLSARPATTWSAEERRRARDLLAGETTALKLLHRAGEVGTPATSLIGNDAGSADHGALLSHLRSIRMLAVHSQLAWESGEPQEAFRSLAALATLTTGLQGSNTIAGLLVGGAGEKLLHGAVHPLVEDPTTSADHLARIVALVPTEDVSRRWRCTLLKDLNDLEHKVAQQLAAGGAPSRWWLPHPTGPLLKAQLLAFYTRLATAFDEPFGGEPAWAARPSLWRDGVIGTISAPNLIAAAARLQHLAASRQLLHAAIALRLQALASGTYPTSLSHIPGASRPDPFTGEPLQYTLEENGSVTLSSPRMAQLWRDMRVAGQLSHVAPTTWRLPPPARRPGSSPSASAPAQ